MNGNQQNAFHLILVSYFCIKISQLNYVENIGARLKTQNWMVLFSETGDMLFLDMPPLHLFYSGKKKNYFTFFLKTLLKRHLPN